MESLGQAMDHIFNRSIHISHINQFPHNGGKGEWLTLGTPEFYKFIERHVYANVTVDETKNLWPFTYVLDEHRLIWEITILNNESNEFDSMPDDDILKALCLIKEGYKIGPAINELNNVTVYSFIDRQDLVIQLIDDQYFNEEKLREIYKSSSSIRFDSRYVEHFCDILKQEGFKFDESSWDNFVYIIKK